MRSAFRLAALLAFASMAQAADREAGRTKAAACAVCHGPLGLAVLPNAPHLAGQPEIYLAEQLRNYRSGRRSNEVMAVVAKTLSDAEIDDLAAWYGSLKLEVREPR
jgi:cytochrome c553